MKQFRQQRDGFSITEDEREEEEEAEKNPEVVSTFPFFANNHLEQLNKNIMVFVTCSPLRMGVLLFV